MKSIPNSQTESPKSNLPVRREVITRKKRDRRPASGARALPQTGPQPSLSETFADLRGCLKSAPEDLAGWIAPELDPVGWESKPIKPGQGCLCTDSAIIIGLLNGRDPNSEWVSKLLGQLSAPLILPDMVMADVAWKIGRTDKSGAVLKLLRAHIKAGTIAILPDRQSPNMRSIRELFESVAPALDELGISAISPLGIIQPMPISLDAVEPPLEHGKKCPCCGVECVRKLTPHEVKKLQSGANCPHGLSMGDNREWCPSCKWIAPCRSERGTEPIFEN